MQEQHSHGAVQLASACAAALSHVPLLRGASIGPDAAAPDLPALQRQLAYGLSVLQSAGPALAALLGPTAFSRAVAQGQAGAAPTTTTSNTNTTITAVGDVPDVAAGGVGVTAALAAQLLAVAGEECALLRELGASLGGLADLTLYANSLEVQSAHMAHAGVATARC